MESEEQRPADPDNEQSPGDGYAAPAGGEHADREAQDAPDTSSGREGEADQATGNPGAAGGE